MRDMARWVLLGGLIALVAWTGAARAQTLPLPPGANMQRDTVDLGQARPFDLEPFIQPGTAKVFLNGAFLDSTRYRLDHRRGHLRIAQALNPALDTLVAVYRTLPFALDDVYRRNVARVRSDTSTAGGAADSTTVVRSTAEREDTEFDPFGDMNLQRSGSISRGVLAGNRRDATIESGLRMQLSGEVTKGVDVEAVLTDENTPIQPEGTTQRLSDFDRVFVQLKHRRGTARLGDFDLNLDGGTFARFSRKLQGATVRATAPRYEPVFFGGGHLEVAGAVSRGQFRTQDLDLIDGVQGPYRLTGKQGERFIIVVAGSEKVFLNGERLERGKTNDYVIDYATGEITFTSDVLITADKRVTVEFEYRANRFTRTLVGSEAAFDVGRMADGSARGHFAATFLRESDNRSLDDAVGLSAEDSTRIAEAGDGEAFRSGAERVAYDAEAPYVQYVRQPNPTGSGDSVYVPLTRRPREGEAVYRVRFSRTESGRGSYARVGQTSGGVAFNGIAYEYRGPGRGDYVPRRPLPTPQSKRVADLRGRFAPIQNVELFGEWAGSMNDLNRLSGLGDTDNQGNAYRAGLRVKPMSVGWGGWSFGTLGGSVQRRRTGRQFAAFDRIRPVEFERRWNLERRGQRNANVTQPLGSTREVIDEGKLRWQPFGASSVRAEYGRLERGAAFTGIRRALYAESEETGWPVLDYRLEYITSRDSLANPLTDGQWLRQRGQLRHTFGGFTPRLGLEQERRRQRRVRTDSLTRGSLSFVELRPGVSYESGKVQAGGEVEFRTEDRSIEGDLNDAARAWTASVNAAYQPGPLFNTETRLGYRQKHYTDAFRRQRQRRDTESLLLEWRGRYRPLERAAQLNWRYEGRTERTPTLQEIYVKTGPERGQYVWEDGNDDGVQQLDEFLPERTPNEGTYVQTYVPSDSLTSVVNVEAQAQLQLEPARYWKNASARWKRWLRQAETRTTVEVAEKSRNPRLFQIYALNLSRFRDPANTISGRLRIKQDLSLFQEKPRYGLDFSWNQVRGLSELAAGQTERFTNNWSAEGRVRLASQWTASLRGAWERRRTISEAFSSRTFDITSRSLNPETSFRPLEAVRMTAGASWSRKRDDEAGQRARIIKLPVEARLTGQGRLQVRADAEVSFVNLTETEEATGLTQYELTDGRGPGRSVRWHLGGQYRVNEYLRASLSYDGRAPTSAPTVHTVRMNLNATF
jgi:hypothetical protein